MLWQIILLTCSTANLMFFGRGYHIFGKHLLSKCSIYIFKSKNLRVYTDFYTFIQMPENCLTTPLKTGPKHFDPPPKRGPKLFELPIQIGIYIHAYTYSYTCRFMCISPYQFIYFNLQAHYY